MGKWANAELSATFLGTHRARLDAIGPWVVSSDPFNLEVMWRRPAVLQGAWVPLNLRFRMASGSAVATLEPDEPMFELWELFLSRRDDFLAQTRDKTAALEEEWGVVDRGRVEVFRGAGAVGADHYALSVYVRYAEDDEHEFFCEYEPDSGRFGRLQG